VKLGIVTARYGGDVLGGAETLARTLAEQLSHTNIEIEVLTTCARDLYTWHNELPVGPDWLNGVAVRRFPIDHRFRDEKRFRALVQQFNNHAPATSDDEDAWVEHSAHSPALYNYLARYGAAYDYLIFLPYLFGTTLYGALIQPEHSLIWPCLHDEAYAYFQHTRMLLDTCRGILFLSQPEQDLARAKLRIRNPRQAVIGMGVDEITGMPDRFCQRWGITEPFILYAGRFDGVKNLLELAAFFAEYKRRRPGPLKLVLMGDGPLALPPHRDMITIGFQSEADKAAAFAAATVVCQPSLLESFSLAIMEAWLAGVPVLVHEGCAVTCYHVQRSNGGLYYLDVDEFCAALDWLLEHPAERTRLGQQGRVYVQREYNWSAVLERLQTVLYAWRDRGQ
jgi:glycosyltransferase involved in cell wall biosynthesis